MKMIQAYIRTHMASKVLDALRSERIHGVSVFHGKGFGELAEATEPHYRDPDNAVGFVEVTKLELVCDDSAVETVLETICARGHTGRYGDGKVFVFDVGTACDIRTGTRGNGAV